MRMNERCTLQEGTVMESFRARMMSTKAIGSSVKDGYGTSKFESGGRYQGQWKRGAEEGNGSACIQMGACVGLFFAVGVVRG